MGKVKENTYITIQSFMVNDLELKGNELLIYAIIYGFSQDEETTFAGSLQYLANWTNSTKQGIIKNLKSLVDKGYIGKKETYKNNIKFVEYYTTKFNEGIKQSLTGGIKQSLTNNIDNNNINNNIDIKKNIKKKNNINELINEYTTNEDLRQALEDFKEMRNTIKAPLTERALKNIFKQLDQYSFNDDNIKIQIIDQSINNSWRGIFPLKNNFNSNSNYTPVNKGEIKQNLDEELILF